MLCNNSPFPSLPLPSPPLSSSPLPQTIDDVANLRMGRWQQNMVPIKEMTDVLKVVKDTGGIKLNSWVRLKRGIFMDDIAQVGGTRLWPTLVSGPWGCGSV